MSDQMLNYFLEVVKNTELPTETVFDDESRAIFERGLDVMLMFRGDPSTLMEALQIFVLTESLPYVYAGIAQVLSAAAYESSKNYDKEGMQAAQQWLEKAQQIASDRFEINLIKPGLLGNMNKPQEMRAELDILYTHPEARASYRFAQTEAWYWDRANDLSMVKLWSETAFKLAQNNIQKLFVLNSLAGTYLQKSKFEDALGLYQEVVKINPNDPWAWHNMSIIFNRFKDYGNAGYCNYRALQIMDFEAARSIQRSLIKIWSQYRHPDLLDDLPPYSIRPGQNIWRDKHRFTKR